jgi:hypothetical protein
MMTTNRVHAPGSLCPHDSATRSRSTLVVRIVGTTVYPYACDGQVLAVLDARYMAVYTPRAFAAIARYVLRRVRDVRAVSAVLAVARADATPQTALLVETLCSALRRSSVTVAVIWASTWRFPATARVVDCRLAWQLMNILDRPRPDPPG